MKASLRAKLEQLASRLQELDRLLSEESAAKDMDSFRKLAREHSDLSSVVGLYVQYKLAEGDAEAAKDMASDPAMKSFALSSSSAKLFIAGSEAMSFAASASPSASLYCA